MGLRDKLKRFGGRSGPVRERLTRKEMREIAARFGSDTGQTEKRTDDSDADEMFRAAEENATARAPVDAELTPGNPEEVEHLARGNGDDGEMENFVLGSRTRDESEDSDDGGFFVDSMDWSGLFGGDE